MQKPGIDHQNLPAKTLPPPQGRWWHAPQPEKRSAHGFRVGETAVAGRGLHCSAIFQLAGGGFDAQAFDGAGRRCAGFGGEAAGKMTRTHAGAGGEVFDAERLVEMAADVVEQDKRS